MSALTVALACALGGRLDLLAHWPGVARAAAHRTAREPAAARWSAPATLSACPGASPRVAFPSDSPTNATGHGAIVWSASDRCPGGAGARLAAIASDDRPSAAIAPRSGTGERAVGQLTLTGGPHGQIVIAGADPGAAGRGQVLAGLARGPFTALPAREAPTDPLALARAYLGDVALLSRTAGSRAGLSLRIARYFAHTFGAAEQVATGATGALSAVTVALDYRTDALAAWASGGAIYARDLPARGPSHPVQRLAAAGSQLRIVALLSDDDRAILAWSERQGHTTSVYVDQSSTGVRFGRPRLLERYQDPGGLRPPEGSPSLVRLSSESVMIAWAGAAAGRWVVRTAPIDLDGMGASSTIAARDGDALLADLAPGPDGEALALWTEPMRATAAGAETPDVSDQAIFTSRVIDASPARTIAGAPEQVAGAAPASEPRVAIDPDSDRAIVVWQAQGGSIDYSLRGVADP